MKSLEKANKYLKEIQSDFRKAKVLKISKEQEELVDYYNSIIEKKKTLEKRLFFDIETSPNLVFSWNWKKNKY